MLTSGSDNFNNVSQSVFLRTSNKMTKVVSNSRAGASVHMKGGNNCEELQPKNYDQYANGKAARIWEVFVGDRKAREKNIKGFLVDILKRNGCKRVLDAACGTGVDSVILLEQGFEVVSVDASDQMLKSAYRERWNRRKDPAFDSWVIEEGNWLTIADDIQPYLAEGFDAVICLGSSFSHLHDTNGDQKEHKQAICNFMKCLKPGGILIIDHRNYDQLIKIGDTSESDYNNNVYYNACDKVPIRINTRIHYECGTPKIITRDYFIGDGKDVTELNFSFHPHTLDSFTDLLKGVFGSDASYKVYGDFKLLNEIDVPTYYIHQIQRKL